MDKHFKEMTIQELCQIMNLPLPAHMENKKHVKINHIALIASHVKEGSAYFVCLDEPNISKILKQAMKNKASVIFVPEKAFKASQFNEKSYPVIFTDNWLKRLGMLYSSIRRSYKAKTIAVTGTVGKTTTKEFMSAVIGNDQKLFCNNGNRNSFLTVAKHITEDLTDEYDTYIQEIGAGTPQSIEKSGAMLSPDYFVILNVKNHHLNTYKTFESLFEDKTSVDKHMPEHGIIIANYDDAALASHTFLHPVISFGIHTDKAVTYRAANITEKDGVLSFDILTENETYSLSINILGKHNVYNAMAAFILAKELSVPTDKIIQNLTLYQTSGIRQNYQNVGGYHLYVDCYNVAFDSIMAGIHTIQDFSLKENARRIAVIGGENKLGPDAPSLSYEFGLQLAKTNIDLFFCYGHNDRSEESLNTYGDAKSICEALQKDGKKHAEFISDPNTLIQRLQETVKTGDIVFFKGIYLLDMPYIIDKVFGSSFAAKSEHYLKDAEYTASSSFQFRQLPIGNELELYKPLKKQFFPRIPDNFRHQAVYRISESAFASRRILGIKFGKNIKNIASDAFKNSSYLKKIHFPSNVKVIEKRAFLNCKRLKTVIFDEGIRHLGRHVFRNCPNLKDIYLPESIGYIDDTTFIDCPLLTIHCKQGSYVEEYAQRNGLHYYTDL